MIGKVKNLGDFIPNELKIALICSVQSFSLTKHLEKSPSKFRYVQSHMSSNMLFSIARRFCSGCPRIMIYGLVSSIPDINIRCLLKLQVETRLKSVDNSEARSLSPVADRGVRAIWWSM